MKWLMKWGWMWIYLILMTGTVIYITLGKHEPIEVDSPEKITLTFRHTWIKEHDRALLAIFEEVVFNYEQTHPNVKVNFEGIDQTIHRETKLKSEMVYGTQPDMFVLFGGAEIEPYVNSNRLMDLTDFAKENDLVGQFKDLHLWTINNHLYGLPLEGNAEPLYYNKTVFSQLGIPIPETLDELDTAILKLKKGGYIPFALGNEDSWPAGIFAQYLMDRYAGPELIKKLITGEDKQSFQNTYFSKAFQHLDQWIQEDAFSFNSNNLSTEHAVELFASSKAAMYLNGNWDINLFSGASAPDHFLNEVGVIPFPVLHKGDAASIAGGYTFGIGLSSNLSGAKREAALELMKDFYTQEIQTRLVYEGLRIPSMAITYDPDKIDPVFAQVMQLMEDNRESFVPYDNILSPEVKKTFLNAIEEMIAGEMSANQALRQLQITSMQYWKLIKNSTVQ